MTQPSGEYPDGAFNLDSLAELAARPQSEWEAQMRGQTSNGFELVLSALFGPLPADLREGIEFTRALVTAIIRQILNLPGQIWDSVEDALAALAGWVADIPIIGDILTIINDTFSAIFGGIDFTGTLPTPAEVWQTVINTLMLPLNLLLGPGSRIELPQLPSVFLGSLTTASPNFLEAFSAMSVPTSDGWSYDSVADAAKVVCDGSTKTLYLSGPVIPVEAGQPLNIAQKVRYSGVTSGAGQTIQFVLETFASDDGSGTATPVVVDGITNPSGTASTVTIGDPDWDPPPGVESVRPVLVVDELVTAGTVFWENRPSLKKGLDSALSGGLPKAIQDRIDDMQATWDKFKGAAGGTVDDIEDALNGAGQAIRDAIANALGHSGTGHTSANILTYLQNIPQTVVTGLTDSLGDLQTTLNQIGDIFANTVVTPINGVVQAIKDWWNQWFGGGSTNAIPLSQKGASNGVATLDSTGNVPLSQLGNVPASGGEPNDHILFTLPANQSIPNGTATSLTGWQQVGSVTATFDDGTNTRFTLPKAGWWDIQSQVAWASSATGKRQSAVVRTLTSGSAIPATSGEDAADHPAWPVRNKIRDTQEVASRGSLATTDKFSIQVYQNSGAALNVVSGYPDGTYVLATYLGERKFEAFSEENVNRTNQPVPDGVAGCWVTLGGGSGGGGGGQKNTPAAYGGGGGGGGAKIFRTWIPVSLLGSTYSVTRGTYGLPGVGGTTGNGGTGGNGGASTFTSGSVSMSAGGGAGGTGGSTSATVPGGAGGTASVSGTTATTAAGTAGGSGGSSASAGVNNTAGGGAGGGGGGTSSGSVSPGKGGDSTAAAGTAAAAANQTGANPAAGGGGGNSAGITAGRNGGDGCGAGGGGGGAGGTSFGADGGDGGRGYTLIEWK